MKRLFGAISVIFSFLFVFYGLSYAQLPSYKKLCSVMENISGWQLDEKCDGTNMSGTSVGSVVIATKTFSKGDKKLEISVISGMQAMASWGMFQTGISIETNDSLMKTMNIQEYRGGVSYDKKANSGVVYVCLKNVNSQCRVLFSLKFDNIKYKDAIDLVKNYNLKAIRDAF